MSNFHKKLKDLTDEELEAGANEHSPNFGILEANELLRRSINKVEKEINQLKDSIDCFSLSSDIYSGRIVFLTWLLVMLTFILAMPLLLDFLNFLIKLFEK